MDKVNAIQRENSNEKPAFFLNFIQEHLQRRPEQQRNPINFVFLIRS